MWAVMCIDQRHCVHFKGRGCVVLVALFVDFQWCVSISLTMDLLEVLDGVVVGVSCTLLSGLASSNY